MTDRERARTLILRYGWNATAYQILNPGMRHWFAAAGDGVAGYVVHSRRWIVAGAPICSADRLPDIARELERVLADAHTHRPLLLGAQPVWNAGEWPAIVQRKASLRAQLNRARNKQVTVSEWTPDNASRHPSLRGVLEEWLHSRGLPPLRFMTESDTLGDLRDRRVFVAERAGDGVIGFLVATPVPARDGWLVEQWPRAMRAPNGTTHLLVDAAMRALGADGSRYVTLGLAPLSDRAGRIGAGQPLWLRALLKWVRAHGRRFYNFRGLDAFKTSLEPMSWEPVYALVRGEHIGPGALRAIAGAFGGGSPERLIAKALWMAIAREVGAIRKVLPAATRVVACAIAIILGGCKSGESPAFTVRDSAGVRIVENHRPVWASDERWSIDSTPLLEIAREDLNQLGQMYRMSDGRIVVAHDGASEILVFASNGELLTRMGRRGRGPGEFIELSRLMRTATGDSVVLFDLMQNRISTFDMQGKLARIEPVATDAIQAIVEGRFDDGSYVMAMPSFPDLSARGLVRPTRQLRRRLVDGTITDLTQVPGNETYYQELPGGQVDFRAPFFGHATYTAVGRDRLVWAATDTFRLHVLAPNGMTRLLIDKDHPVRRVTSVDVEPLIAERVAAVRDESAKPLVRRSFSAVPLGTLPVLGAVPSNGPPLLIDDAGNIWVAELTMPGDERNSRFVFDSAGAWLGSVELPPRFAPRHVGTDFVLGKALDSLDVEHIRMYALRKRR